MKRKIEISKKTVPTIFQVRSSRARAFQSTASSFSALNAFISVLIDFFAGLAFVFLFPLLAIAAKIISLLLKLPFQVQSSTKSEYQYFRKIYRKVVCR